MRSDVVVLGAGIVGVSAAFHLLLRGKSVTIIDRLGGAAGETSYGNTGIIQSEAVFPYTFPREPVEVLKAAANQDPKAQVRYSALPSIAPFLARYFLASAPEERFRSGQALRKLVACAVEEHRAMAAAAGAQGLLRGGGWIKVFRTERGRETGLRDAEEVAVYGVPYRVLDRGGLAELEPNVGGAAICGIHFSDPLTTPNPGALVKAYADHFIASGGRFLRGDATTLSQTGQRWRVETEAGTLEAGEAVLALGAWSEPLARALGYVFPFGVKRGYHMHYAPRDGATLTRPVLDFERGYVVTPMDKGLRLTTGAEFAKPEDPPSSAHLDRLEPFGREMFPLGPRLEAEPWLGRRPCLPDMLPIIGPAPRHDGLWFDFGHQHLGLTLGPISGRLLADLMTGAAPCVDPSPYRAQRF